MAKETLNERYRRKQVAQLKERMDSRDVLIEQLILEKFDKETARQATLVIKALNSLDFGAAGLKTLAAARDAAVQDANRALGGKSNQGVLRRIIGLFKDGGAGNPVVDSIAFANAVSNFFETFNEYLEGYKGKVQAGGGDADEMSVQQLVTGVSPDQASVADAAAAAEGDAKENLKLLQQVITKGLKPDGALAQVGKTWQKKYLKNNWGQLAQDIMQAKVGEVQKVGKESMAALKNSSAVGQAAAGAQQVATKATSGTTGTEKTGSTEQTSGTVPGEASKETAETGESTPGGGNVADKVIQRLEKANISGQLDIPQGQVQALVQILAKLGHLK